jgi:5'-nucleotidase/UDP-sugar diphosphatase
MRFSYDLSRPKFDVVTVIELGDFDRGYRAIDISGKCEKLYSLTCPQMFGQILVAIPQYTKGKLALVAKNKILLECMQEPSNRLSRLGKM